MLRIDITTVTVVRPEYADNANRILDAMDRERECALSDWMTTITRNPRGTMPQYEGFRSDWYDWEEGEPDFVDDQMSGDRIYVSIF